MDRIYNKYISPDGKVSIYNGNCLDILKEIENETVGLVITSPPYCIGKEYEDINDDIDSFKNLNTKVISESIRVLKKAEVCAGKLDFTLKTML